MENKLSFNIPPTCFVQAGSFDERAIVINSCVNCGVLKRES